MSDVKEKESVIEELDSIVIHFAGDSGDGMQLTGTQFTNTSAVFGNDVSTLPDFPAEIRAPAGTLPGVSGFQVKFSSEDILTPGDEPEVLVAMNPAALKKSLPELKKGGTIIVNTDAFNQQNLRKAGYETSPLDDSSLAGYQVHQVPLTSLNRDALKDVQGLSSKDKDRSQNFFALGLSFWIFDRPIDTTLAWIDKKFTGKPELIEANTKALKMGYYYGENTEIFRQRYRVRPAALPPGVYRKITGNEATAMGLVTAAQKAGKSLFYGSYPITPASDILHFLAPLRHYDVRTFQAEDEIAAIGSVIGAAFGGAIAVTGTSGPGLALKSEAINLAIVLELPMVIVDVQRGGPSTGLPTKTEQSDLLQAMFGRNGESPIPIVAPQSPADCFDMAIEAVRLAIRGMTPVLYLSEGFLANSSEPWLLPNPDDIAPIVVNHPGPRQDGNGQEPFLPYLRDEMTLARPWALPGTAGLEHRLGGLSKAPVTGNVSYAPQDHERMVTDRAHKVAALADVIPDQEVFGPKAGDLLLVSWGGTYGAVRTAVRRAQQEGKSVAHAHLRYLNPFPRNLRDILSRYKRIVTPELNSGQLAFLLRGRYAINVQPYPKLHARPFTIREIYEKIMELS
ncbi:MAG: 2-oxoacid:acceptor oxidoreductase subunit alpha [Chloroflexi bacterium]|nr:2-oxoacid:acceptor oxidoreductase subunit alpha [Chloroflexota bacterium]MCI0580905.1 2-oxoacid:acceptor oxidoreductase subunit alpha [Chloroflexota bacterium]MCI0649753.1 2-oxoacid:acceptor oxidoreductase subunit alpha [Chloroflexota bacterium]MCI0725492.1 2-oxoacid:acceptor oxidoreductase subunit alpha [Chloroflexota bacterium]